MVVPYFLIFLINPIFKASYLLGGFFLISI
ncbi:pyr operon leader peptide [Aliivibrio fischeri ES114]|uniref:Pyr operon leader peptide n=2 Tax=Aliivibrio fischeri TaxID=668 RepID=B1WN00_ALIF1|nr:pyr operon leader peptide [Aliivibrio fischeri ES114]MUI55736.1 hypothetical protein [Aliivibrio fischeri]MUJ37556.1 hypothetical protein [Aliivibrio fischeri]MUK30585.1 hypothetical protein [Aliivibrio fischeri]MUK47645.1 hypothetical protein [Aliivibrio fischeri]